MSLPNVPEGQEHPRTQIREHVRLALIGQTTAEDRVYASRTLPLQEDDLAALGPAICVYTIDDPIDDDPASESPLEFRSRLTVRCEIVVTSDLPDLQAALDRIELGVLRVVLSDERQGGAAEETTCRGSTFTFDPETQAPTASQVLEFEVTYLVKGSVDLVSDDLATVHALWDMTPVNGQTDAEDELTFEE